MRSKGTQQRGKIALIRKGSRMVVGVADLVGSHGPLEEEMLANQGSHLITPERPEHAKCFEVATRLDIGKRPPPGPPGALFSPQRCRDLG